MDKRLSREKRARLDREVPRGIGKEERKLGKDKIEKEIDTLRTRLVEARVGRNSVLAYCAAWEV
jgi:hypothetical protein